MMQVIRAALLLVLVGLTDLPATAQDDAPSPAIRAILAAGAPPVTDIDAALGADALAELKRVYAARADRPIWPEAEARALLDRLSEPDITVGPKLRPLLDEARKRMGSPDPQAKAGADLLLTALYGATAQALRPGAPAGFPAALAELGGATDVMALLREPAPSEAQTAPPEMPKVETPPPVAAAETPEAARLKAAFEALKNEWPVVPDGPKLQLGDSGPRVEALSRRLIASGDLAAEAPSASFDAALKVALERFQARHGLTPDGVAGAGTLAALNVPAKERQATLMQNTVREAGYKRAAWGDRYLVVNLPAATYRLVESGRTVLQGPVQVGAPGTPTPLLDGMIDRIEMRPSYRIPQSVADRELWPRQEADALYFINHGIRVTDDGLRQVPGSSNPLGIAKLMIAGEDRIALHGVPANGAVEAPERHASLGCVAVADIAALVRALLDGDPAWPEGRIAGALGAGGTQRVALPNPLPVHFIYQTAWVEPDGTIQFRDDVYGWDKQTSPAEANPVADPCGS